MQHSKSTQTFRLTVLSLLLLEALPTFAAAPPLSNSPINQLSLVPPNILFMMDRSGSMASAHVPDEAASGTTDMRNKVGYYNYHCNALAYNPNYAYVAPINADGSLIATAVDVPIGTANKASAAYDNGFGTATTTMTGKTDLTAANTFFYYDYTGPASGVPTVYSDAKCRESYSGTTNFTLRWVSSLSAADQANYANWYAYYRNRLLMMKTAVGLAFKGLGSEVRFGYMTIDTTPGTITTTANVTNFLKTATMDATQRNSFYTKFYSLATSGSTPLREALSGAGLYFANKYGDQPVLPNGPTSGGECQRNFTILSTDGYWNELNGNTNPINKIGTADLSWSSSSSTGSYITDQDSSSPTADAFALRADGVYAPTGSNATGTSTTNMTLADVALYYYKSDLLPSYRKLDPHRDNFTKSDGTANVPDLKPPYIYRNMTTYTVGVGVAGTLKYVDDYLTNTDNTKNDFINIKSGSVNWPAPNNNTITTADDLWHAAVSGRGTFFSAGDANSMSKGLASTLGKITSDTVRSIAPVVNSPALTQDNNITYNPNYRSGSWTGRLDAIVIDPVTSLPLKVTPSGPNQPPIWSAHLKLDLQAGAYDKGTGSTPATPPAGLISNGWDTGRKIFLGSSTAGAGVPFRWANLTSAQQATLTDGVTSTALAALKPAITRTYGELVLEYIRGSQAYEEDVSGVHTQVVANQLFRGRGDNTTSLGGDVTQGILGDIVDSKPVVVKAPDEAYEDTDNPGYSNFKTANASRTPMVYVGANDGMLHAFNASSQVVSGATVATANSGREEWAYIPSSLLRGTSDENSKKNGLQSYSYPLGGNPALNVPKFEKHFFVNGPVRVNDVDFNRTDTATGGTMSATPDWRSLLVGSLSKGGKSYYALDVTKGDTTNAGAALTEATAANKFLWEFTDADMGYTYGNAVISRHATYGWVTAVTSGYNNTSGNGYVWVLNARTGQLIQKFTISSSCSGNACANESGLSATNPLNLGRIVGYVYSVASEQLLAIYGGDMQGNVWRIDTSDANKANWTIKKLAKLTSPSGNGVYGNTNQPITMAPTVQYDLSTDRRWVFVGTGMDLSKDDRTASKDQANQQQTMYALIDGTGPVPLPDSALPIQRSQLVAASNSSVAAVALTGTQNRGWMIDLDRPSTNTLAERIVLQPVARFGAVVFTSSTPVTDVCAPGYTGKAYARGYLDGQLGSSFIQQNGAYVASVYSAAGYAANPGLIQLAKNTGSGGGATKLQACDLKGNCTLIDLIFPSLSGQSRVSWRELLNQ